jgi:hypothetical protein
MKLNYDDD